MLGSGDLGKKTGWYIPTAALRDGWSEATARSRMQNIQRRYGLGRLQWIDMEYVKGDKLRKAVQALGKIDFIWAEVGNTYNLAYHMWNSGGAEIVQQLVGEDTLYLGSSAGSIMAGRTIQTAFWKDWDDRTCEGTVSVDWHRAENARGLNLAGGRSIFPHANGPYGSTH